MRIGSVTIDTADSALAALDRVDEKEYDAIATAIKMPGIDGRALLAAIHARRPGTPTLLIIGPGEHALAINALRGGACDFIQKPIDHERFVASVRRAIEGKMVASPLKALVSPSPLMATVVEAIRQVADSPLSILVQGETGTGKELVARAIHHLSPRGRHAFVAVDCGAIPDSLIESELFGFERGAFTGAHQRKDGQVQVARGGSLFLDEITNLPLATQSKLLRVLQERQARPLGGPRPVPIDVRIIAASNRSLEREVEEGRFRQDVYYRLNEFIITLPPLRERDDLLDLANKFLAEASTEFARPCAGISAQAAAVLERHRWPGNVRELRNVIRRATLLASDTIEPRHLAFRPVNGSELPIPSCEPPTGTSLKEIADAAAADAEQKAIRRTLETTKGNKTEAARLLRTDFKTLHLKMKQYGIDPLLFKEMRAAG